MNSKLSRFLDPEDQTALLRSLYTWNSEEDAALISRKAIPLLKLTRAQSAHRRALISKLGGATQAKKVFYLCTFFQNGILSVHSFPNHVPGFFRSAVKD